jgi:TonB family protein
VVTISFDIDETGHPVHFQIEKPTQPVWGKQAIAIVKGWRFSPARSN